MRLRRNRLTKLKKHIAAQREAENRQWAKIIQLGLPRKHRAQRRAIRDKNGTIVEWNYSNRGFTRPLSGGPSRTRGGR